MGRECVGGVEDRGQVKPKHGAQKKESSASLPSLHTTIQRNSSSRIMAKLNHIDIFFHIKDYMHCVHKPTVLT